jgi:hypothetical protein
MSVGVCGEGRRLAHGREQACARPTQAALRGIDE